MRKIDWIFIALIVLEVVFVAYVVQAPHCGSFCRENRSFLTPFGHDKQTGICEVLDACSMEPHPLFFISIDLLVVTLFAYAVYWASRKMRSK
jgi:hypothetical protein